MHSGIATLILASFVCVSAARAQAPTYELTFLGAAPGGVGTSPTAVNDDGLVVGTESVGGFTVGFVASPTQAHTVLPVLPGHLGSVPCAVNNAGVIVGASGTWPQQNLVAVIWTPTPSGYVVAPLPLTPQGGQPMFARALNELGDVVGELTNGDGFTWTAAGGTSALPAGITGAAYGVNESRQVVAGKWRFDLDTLAVDTANLGTNPAYFTGINDAGVCSTKHFFTSPFQGSGGGIYEFGVGLVNYGVGPYGYVIGHDYAGDAVYTGSIGTPSGDAVHYDDIGNVTLDSRLDPAFANWSIDFFLQGGMSANGRIAMFGSDGVQAGAVLLTPTRFHAILEGAPGATGLPVLVGNGTLVANSPVSFKLSRAAPSAPVGLIAGLGRVDLPFYGGLLVPAPTLVLTGLSTDANGKLTLATTWPAGLPSGTKVYLQEWIVDANAPAGIAGSNALECVTP